MIFEFRKLTLKVQYILAFFAETAHLGKAFGATYSQKRWLIMYSEVSNKNGIFLILFEKMSYQNLHIY